MSRKIEHEETLVEKRDRVDEPGADALATLRLVSRSARRTTAERDEGRAGVSLDDWLGTSHSSSELPATRPDKDKRAQRKSRAAKIKGNRGVDTLLRNAYRAQLDMLALAATKANIMISLNGLLMSMLVLSGTHFLSIDTLFAIPISIFLLGCATATVFAVLAARPDVSQTTFGFTDFERDDARLLVFEEFSDLTEDEYIEAMTQMLSSPKRVYRSMVAHVHELGSTADRKYRRLYYSYTVFMAGFILSATSLVVVQALRWSGTLP